MWVEEKKYKPPAIGMTLSRTSPEDWSKRSQGNDITTWVEKMVELRQFIVEASQCTYNI